ncbi:von Willebrand factor type A domain-containing protein [Massariosphaeria phaeospora]|uniref:von Willebrand factor type A domain-containing protein n=1 Tax=Massariosphaeria phaeospora TaxID=100035 RepID=A0A7C8I5S5_9PLEO|nr:von Willebrand factor type A domain-containing protein [Massariosphaeria phaeospora]
MFGQNVLPTWRQHACGLHYTLPNTGHPNKLYHLPPVDLRAHATILSNTSRTLLTQTFVNPSTTKGIREVRYTFPLYDGVSVVAFTCCVGDRTIIGEVKEKEKARAVFQEAVARGETAGLFEQLPDAADVFTTTVGNIPPGASVLIKLTYLGELKHDMEVDGIRFTIPNVIFSRYGSTPQALSGTRAVGNGMSITVDAEMAEGSVIQQIQSPSHPISVTVGTTSLARNATPNMTKASVTLSNITSLDKDFVLQIVAKDTGVPKAILETHPTIPGHRALMATLVPKFALPSEKPEVVFVCDRSGSMQGSSIELVKQALKVFLKSLPVGVKFNICSFGSSYSFLWPKSVSYSQQTLDEAVRHAETFSANYGGTEMLTPLKATIEQRYKDIPLEVMLLTDGEIWDQQTLFSYLNTEVGETKASIRVFTLGIGNGVSLSLIEGIARAGNGFSQTVDDNEKMDSKVVRMLKGALSAHVNDYKIEVKYSASTEEEEDFEIIEKVADSLTIKLDLKEKEARQEPKKPISLFDPSVDLDRDEPPVHDETGESRYAHLPKVTVPRIIQAPQDIPALFAFNRTTVYLLLGPDAPRQTPKSVVLRGTSVHGPLELEIPIQVLETPGEMIHQLAAKKAIAELEQGRGWLPEAKDASGEPLKSAFESRFEDMVEREAVRLGVQFQVGGKWCSFVAVEKDKSAVEKEDYEWIEDEVPILQTNNNPFAKGPTPPLGPSGGFGASSLFGNSNSSSAGAGIQPSSGLFGGGGLFGSTQSAPPSGAGGLFGAANTTSAAQPSSGLLGSGGLFGSSENAPLSVASGGSLFGNSNTVTSLAGAGVKLSSGLVGSGGLFGSSQNAPSLGPNAPAAHGAPAPSASQASQFASGESTLQDYQMQCMLLKQENKNRLLMTRQDPGSTASAPASSPMNAAFAVPPAVLTVDTTHPKTNDELVDFLIGLQTFEGFWEWNSELFNAIKISEAGTESEIVKSGIDKKVFVTALVVAYLEDRLEKFRGSWELVVEKARGWLVGTLGMGDSMEEMVNKARGLV